MMLTRHGRRLKLIVKLLRSKRHTARRLLFRAMMVWKKCAACRHQRNDSAGTRVASECETGAARTARQGRAAVAPARAVLPTWVGHVQRVLDEPHLSS